MTTQDVWQPPRLTHNCHPRVYPEDPTLNVAQRLRSIVPPHSLKRVWMPDCSGMTLVGMRSDCQECKIPSRVVLEARQKKRAGGAQESEVGIQTPDRRFDTNDLPHP